MNLYYVKDGVEIYEGDCRSVLPKLKSKSAALVLTDPPFAIKTSHYQCTNKTKWGRSWSDTSVLAAFWRTIVDMSTPLLKESGHLISFCDATSYAVMFPEMYVNFDRIACLVWDKQHIGLGAGWRHQHELIAACYWRSSQFYGNRNLADVIRCVPTPSSKRKHPVHKPVDLLTRLIEPTTRPGDLVIDPFAGSGTTLLAARRLGRRVIGIEGERKYCRIIAELLDAEAA